VAFEPGNAERSGAEDAEHDADKDESNKGSHRGS
jgi:hypothetical protein